MTILNDRFRLVLESLKRVSNGSIIDRMRRKNPDQALYMYTTLVCRLHQELSAHTE